MECYFPRVTHPDTTTSASQRGQTALVLSGGGARAAYQVGVLKGLAQIWPGDRPPYNVIVGTSAGAVCAAVLATHANDWRMGVQRLEAVWANFSVKQVFHADFRSMLGAGLRWALSAASGGRLARAPRALFDNSPLRTLLAKRIDWDAIREHVGNGSLHALALAATTYAGGHHRVFFEAEACVPEWQGVRRRGTRERLSLDHLMASAAIPFLFPAVRIGDSYYGDGAMRQLAPLSPAIHLGAERLLVLGVRAQYAAGLGSNVHMRHAPSSGEILGFMLDTLFSDQMDADFDQMERTNRFLGEAGRPVMGLRQVSALRLMPSVDPREVAVGHITSLPPALRTLLAIIGAHGETGGLLASYLLFEASFTRALIDMGCTDTLKQRQTLLDFLTK
jgi:NTE family protein